MSVSRRTNLAALCAVLFVCSSIVFAADEKPKADDSSKVAAKMMAESANSAADGMKLLHSIAGEWRIDGQWTDGNPLKARSVYKPGVGNEFVNVQTFVAKPDGGEYQRYENIFGAKDGKLTCWNFSFDGSTDVSSWDVAGNKLSSKKVMKSHADASSTNAAPESILHQSIELVDGNKLRWLVSIETNGETKQIMDGTWIREGAKTGSAK